MAKLVGVTVFTTSEFVKLVEKAIADSRQDRFVMSVRNFHDYRDIVFENPEFHELCETDPYVIYIYELLECWTDSFNRPGDYPSIGSSDWVELAESLLEDIRHHRPPSSRRWNAIYTERCKVCAVFTELRDGRFVCPSCADEMLFGATTDPLS